MLRGPDSSRTRAAVDLIVVLLLLLGETLGGLWPGSGSVGPFSSWFVAGVALFVLRHLVWRRPTLPSIAASRLRRHLAVEGARRAWAVAVTTRVLVLVAGLAAVNAIGYQLAPGQPRVSRNEAINLPMRFDAGWYLGIARNGYDWTPELRRHRHSLAFFPGYPALMRVGGDLLTVPAKIFDAPDALGSGNGRVVWGGVLVSVLAFGAALTKIHRLVAIESGDALRARRAVVLLASYPFGLFFGVPYSESTFLLACAGTVLAWSERRERQAMGWGLAAGLLRSNGWALSIPLVIGVLAGSRRGGRSRAWLAAALMPAAGAAAYSVYVFWLTGSAGEWITAQEGWGGTVAPVEFIGRRVRAVTTEGIGGYFRRDPVDGLTAMAILLALGTAVWHVRRGDHTLAALNVCYLAPALALDLPATGRMTSVLFPIFTCLAAVVRGPAYVLVVAAFLGGQLFLAARFFLWRPPY